MSIRRQESALSSKVYEYSRAIPRRPAQRVENATTAVIILERLWRTVLTERKPLRALLPEAASLAPATHSCRRPISKRPAAKPGVQQPRGGALFRPHLRGRTGRDFKAANTTPIRTKSATRPYHTRCTSSIWTSKPGFGVAKRGAAGQATAQSYRLRCDRSNPPSFLCQLRRRLS
jgi:hypothetical protein